MFVLVYFVCHTPQFKTLVFSSRSESWIVQNFNFTVFEDFCLSLSWKYRFLQNVNHVKVQSKTNKFCKFHVDLTRRRLSNSRFKKLGMVPKKLYRNTLKNVYFWRHIAMLCRPRKGRACDVSITPVNVPLGSLHIVSILFLWFFKIAITSL